MDFLSCFREKSLFQHTFLVAQQYFVIKHMKFTKAIKEEQKYSAK